jgi:hypothetical protein
MRNTTWVYFFKIDSAQEIIGSVTATGVEDAREKIAIIKQLPADEIDRLFVIKQKRRNHGNNLQ